MVASTVYFLQPDAGTVAPLMFLFPMGCTLQYFAYAQRDSALQYSKLVERLNASKIGHYEGRFIRTLQANINTCWKATQAEEPFEDHLVDLKQRTKWWCEKESHSSVEQPQ
jgi:hypothetical protein